MDDEDPARSRLVGKSTDDVLGRVSDALARDRKKLGALARSRGGRLGAAARKQVDAEITGALERLRSVSTTPTATQAKAPPAMPIRGARLGAPLPLPESLQQVLRLRVPPGQRIRVITGPAERRELVELARVGDDNARRAFAAIQHNARSIDALAAAQRELAATQREMARVIAELQSRGDVALLEGMLSGLGELDLGFSRCKKRMKLDARSTRRLIAARTGAVERQVTSMAAAARVQKLNDAATAMQTAAFGTKGNLLDRNNLLIAANHVALGLLGDVAKWLGVPSGPNPLAGLFSPLASLLLAQVALGNRQHERFVSGVASVFLPTGGFQQAAATVPLQRFIAPSLWPAFRRRTNVLVTVVPMVIPAGATASARVVKGVLTITVDGSDFGSPPPFQPVTFRVAWTVDTQEPR
jgi:hypothetical protein